jgi:signal transduction histidine kinase
MRTVGVFLIYAAVVLRSAVVLSGRAYFRGVVLWLAVYGLLMLGRFWLARARSTRQTSLLQLVYLLVQSVCVVQLLITARYEDFLALLFVLLSLDAVAFFGGRRGFAIISAFSLLLVGTLYHSKVSQAFGLTMGAYYSGLCFLFGGYAYQVLKAEAARAQNQQRFSELQSAHRLLQGHAEQAAGLAVEQERTRLARDLHDSVTQTVFSMNLAVQSARLLLIKDPPRAAGQLVRVEELAANALGEIQSLISQLRPRPLKEEGLPAILQRLAAEQQSRAGIKITLVSQGEKALSEPEAAGLYAIAQEALVNIGKHSGASEALLRLDLTGRPACLEIEDQGKGFDLQSALGQRGHLGLAGMLERAREIGWSLSVESRPGHGTRIRVTDQSPGGLG